MVEIFGHYLKTGSGSIIVRLIFADSDTAIIEYDLRWMGTDLPRYRLHWRQYKVSDIYGFLALTAVERYISYDSDETTFEDITSIVDDFTQGDESYPVPYRDMTYEYLRLSAPQTWLADAPDLEDMRQFFHLAHWPETFDLILWRHFSVAFCNDELKDTKLVGVLESLDKMKFTSQVDDEFTWPTHSSSVVLPKDVGEQSEPDETVSDPFLSINEELVCDQCDLDEEEWETLLRDDEYRYVVEDYLL